MRRTFENMALKMASAASGALFLTGESLLSSTITLHATNLDNSYSPLPGFE